MQDVATDCNVAVLFQDGIRKTIGRSNADPLSEEHRPCGSLLIPAVRPSLCCRWEPCPLLRISPVLGFRLFRAHSMTGPTSVFLSSCLPLSFYPPSPLPLWPPPPPATRGPPHALPVSPSSRSTRPAIQTPSFRRSVSLSHHVPTYLVPFFNAYQAQWMQASPLLPHHHPPVIPSPPFTYPSFHSLPLRPLCLLFAALLLVSPSPLSVSPTLFTLSQLVLLTLYDCLGSLQSSL